MAPQAASPRPDGSPLAAARRIAGALLLGVLVLLYLGWPVDPLAGRGPVVQLLGAVAGLLFGLGWLWRSGRMPAVEPPPDPVRERRRRTAPVPGDDVDDASWEPAWDPWRVLGVRSDAMLEEITSAFRAKMAMYRAERIAELDEDLQRLAHERVLEIRRAYEELTQPGGRP